MPTMTTTPRRDGAPAPVHVSATSRIRGRLASVLAVVLGFGAVVLASQELDSYWLFALTTGLVFVVLMQSLGILTGRLGVLGLSQLTFAGVGAMAFQWCAVHEVPGGFFVWLLVAALAAVPLGLVLSAVSTRLRGATFAIAVFSVATTADLVWATTQFPGQDTGLFVLRPELVAGDEDYIVFVALVIVAAMVLLYLIDRSRLGASWVEVQHSERAAAAHGISVVVAKASAFGLSAFLAGLAGGLLVGQQGVTSPESFSSIASLGLFAIAVILGVHHAEAAVLGGLLFALLPAALTQYDIAPNYATVVFGLTAALLLKAGGGRLGQSDILRRSLHARRTAALVRRHDEAAARQADAAPVPPSLGGDTTVAGASLAVEGVSVQFGSTRVLDSVSFTVQPGEVVALIGPNGAGKSTLIDTITGFTPPVEGRVLVDGQDLRRMTPNRRARAGIRRSFQQLFVPGSLTVGAFVRSVARRHLSDQEVDEYLGWFSGPPAEAHLGALDVGSRRLAEIAGLAASHARILLLDEPAAGQGATNSARLAAAIRQIPRVTGSTVVLVEHDMGVIQSACDSLVVLDGGRLLAQGEPSVVLASKEVKAAYLGDPVASPAAAPDPSQHPHSTETSR